MAKPQNDDPQKYPALGRWLMFLDEKKNVNRIVYSIYAICLGLYLVDFVYKKKTYVDIEDVSGFYMLYGFVMCAALVICAKMMRVVLKRDEDYYSPKDVESEEHPDADLEKESIHD